MAQIEILEHERIDDLERNGYRIIQNEKKFCFGMDAVLLSGFARAGKGERVLDLGTGTGIIPILMEAKTEGEHFTGLEIQEDMACPEIPSFEPAMPQREQLESLERAVREVCTHVVEWETDAMDERVNTYVDYMEQHFDDPELCASSLANEFHVSEKYLFTLFKKKTGYSPTSYLHHIRMEKAAQLLRETDDTVQNISVQVGFANFGTFYKAFKREFGVAPGKFRAG